MNVRQQIVEYLKSEKSTTVAAVAKATSIDRGVVRYHLKSMAKDKLVKVARGSSGPNGSAGVELLDAKRATKEAAEWVGREGSIKAGLRKRADSLGGGKRHAARRAGGKPANGIGTSPKNGGEQYLVTHDVQVQNQVVLAVSLFLKEGDALAAAIANAGARIFVGREVKVAHTLVES